MSDQTESNEPADVVERVLRTHMAPVPGLEEEVAFALRGQPCEAMVASDDREPA
jgi:hypothetical protein